LFNYKYHNFTQEPENDPNQSWLAPEEDDFYDQNDEEVFGDMDKEEDYDYSDEEELDEVKTINTKMKKSEFKDKIKEMILKEMEDEKVVDVNDETPESEEDFLAELEGMLNEASEFDINKPARVAEFLKALDVLVDEYHAELYLNDNLYNAIEMVKKSAKDEIGLNEAKGDEEVTDDVTTDDATVDDTETIDTTTTTEVNPDVKAVQDSLTQAQAAAQKLGDPKLTDQIGNTITFFTRNHVVEKGAVAENINEMAGKTLEITKPEDLKKVEGSQIFKYDVFDKEEFEKYKVYILADDKSQAEKIAKEKFPKQFPPYTLDTGYPQKSNAADNLWLGKEKMSFWYGVEKTGTTAESINESKYKKGDMLQTYGGEEEVTVIDIKSNLAAALADTENPKAVRLLKQNLRQNLIDDEDKNKPFYLVTSNSFPEDMYYVESELKSSINEVMFPMLKRILK
jgi:hypothetical protein